MSTAGAWVRSSSAAARWPVLGQALGRLLEGVERRVGFADCIEITLEANPGTFEQVKFADYRRLGINRLSIGVQSFQADKLQALGRIHDGAGQCAPPTWRARPASTTSTST